MLDMNINVPNKKLEKILKSEKNIKKAYNMLSQRITMRLYLEYTMNQPLTNGYRTSTTSGGVNIRFSLM